MNCPIFSKAVKKRNLLGLLFFDHFLLWICIALSAEGYVLLLQIYIERENCLSDS